VAPERCQVQERISCAKHHARTSGQVFHRVLRGRRAALADPGVLRTHRGREFRLPAQDGPEVGVSCKRNNPALRARRCRIFGGLLLFLIALEMVFAREAGTRTSSDEKVESRKRADISVFPLAFPFMAGPGALTTILLWFGPIPVTQHPVQFLLMFACSLVVLACCLFAMWVAGPLMRIMGVTGTNVANRLFGVVLGALAVQFVIDGLRASFALAR